MNHLRLCTLLFLLLTVTGQVFGSVVAETKPRLSGRGAQHIRPTSSENIAPATSRRILPVSGQSEILTSKRLGGANLFSSSLNAVVLLARGMRIEGGISSDTVRTTHHFDIFTDPGAERGTVRLTLSETQPIEVTAFNILGKRVLDIYSGEAHSGINTLSFDTSQLSNGIYICVVRGQRFKSAGKFLISR